MRETIAGSERLPEVCDGTHLGSRLGAVVFAVAGTSFVAYSVLRPSGDTLSAMSTDAWLVSHLCGMAAFVLLVLGLDVLRAVVPGSVSRAAMTSGGLGVAAVLPYYGAEGYALHAAGHLALEDPGAAVVLGPLPDAFRLAPAAGSVFLIGLLAIAVGSVLAAVALWRSVWRSRAGVPLAVGYVLFLPQFFAPHEWRVAHGILLGVGCGAVAATIVRPPRTGPRSSER